MIRYDSTPLSVVILCTCGWRDIRLTADAARAAAVDHERRAHPASFQVRDAARVRRGRNRRP